MAVGADAQDATTPAGQPAPAVPTSVFGNGAQTGGQTAASPFTGGQPAGQATQAAGGYGGMPYNPANRNSQADYPAAEVQTVPIALARRVAARAEEELAMNDLHSMLDRMRDDFDYSPAMVDTMKEENAAYLAYDDARNKVLESLSGDPTYRAMTSLVVTLKQKLEDERPTTVLIKGKAAPEDTERLLAIATLKLSYATSASAMEVAALAADDHVQQTKSRLVTAGQKAAAMRADFERSLRHSNEFLTARRNLDEARINHLTAEAFLEGAVNARTIALDYSYYIHRFDQYSYSPGLLSGGLYTAGYGGYYGR